MHERMREWSQAVDVGDEVVGVVREDAYLMGDDVLVTVVVRATSGKAYEVLEVKYAKWDPALPADVTKSLPGVKDAGDFAFRRIVEEAARDKYMREVELGRREPGPSAGSSAVMSFRTGDKHVAAAREARTRRQWGDDELRRFADVYNAFAADPAVHNPREAVAAEFYMSPNTASKYIRKCREADPPLIEPTEAMREGGAK